MIGQTDPESPQKSYDFFQITGKSDSLASQRSSGSSPTTNWIASTVIETLSGLRLFVLTWSQCRGLLNCFPSRPCDTATGRWPQVSIRHNPPITGQLN